jgi:glycosyltransferase involved in cell wall biosynthesis
VKVVWVNRSFFDYRVPVYGELDDLLGNQLSIIYSLDHTPPRVCRKIKSLLGDRAIGLTGEKGIVRRGDFASDFANLSLEYGHQPGLYRKIRECRPDILIGEGFFKWTVTALAYRILRGTPLIISYERTHHTERHSQWFRTAYRRLALKYVSVICCNGILSKEYCIWLGMPPDRIVTGIAAADSEMFQIKCNSISHHEREIARRAHGLRAPVFLCVSQLVKRKGVRQLLSGWASWVRERPSNHGSLVFVGDGPEKPDLCNYIEREGTEDAHLIGSVDYDDIAQFYSLANVLIIPTLEDNWSIVVPEAMACGLPILCSKFNGSWPELVHDGINGFVFDPLDPEKIKSHLRYFADHQEILPRMGEKSKEIVSNFSPRRAAEAIFHACQIAIESKP